MEALNAETPKDGKVSITVAVDLVIKGIKEPVRFVIETSVKVFPQSESFWKDFYFNTRKFVQQFYLNSKEVKIDFSNNCFIDLNFFISADYNWRRSTLRSTEHRHFWRIGSE